MRRRLRAQIIESDAYIVLVNFGRRYLPLCDLAENAVGSAHSRTHFTKNGRCIPLAVVHANVLVVFQAHNACPDGAQFADDPLITTINVIYAFDYRFALCT